MIHAVDASDELVLAAVAKVRAYETHSHSRARSSVEYAKNVSDEVLARGLAYIANDRSYCVSTAVEILAAFGVTGQDGLALALHAAEKNNQLPMEYEVQPWPDWPEVSNKPLLPTRA